ncbi:hypothetical protein CLOP_g2598 [Closterium sp. NIES-67]|nr:hypothetical protein CLOP_g2598 [Closterium sp. NIES-67]
MRGFSGLLEGVSLALGRPLATAAKRFGDFRGRHIAAPARRWRRPLLHVQAGAGGSCVLCESLSLSSLSCETGISVSVPSRLDVPN